jgi:hypothetical protein
MRPISSRAARESPHKAFANQDPAMEEGEHALPGFFFECDMSKEEYRSYLISAMQTLAADIDPHHQFCQVYKETDPFRFS